MKMLVSVRSVKEALTAARGGADFIDLKEPGAGALGGLPTATIRAIVEALREQGGALSRVLPISATIGDLPMSDVEHIAQRVDAVAACGVDYVKVGIERAAGAGVVLDRLAASGLAVVPVFIADRGFDWRDVGHACAAGFPGVMADTADKLAGSLFDTVPLDDLRRFVDVVRAGGALVGLAGALRAVHVPRLRALGPDFAGFRSAVCVGARNAALDAALLTALAALLRNGAAAAAHAGQAST